MQILQPHSLYQMVRNKSVMLLASHLEEVTSISTVQRRLKGSSSKIREKIPLTFATAKWMELKSAYQLERRSKFRFYFRLFFDLFVVALVNSFYSV